MAEKYYSILTNRGKELEAQSSATGKPVIIKDFVVGDGNGQAVEPDPAQTKLVREVYRNAISALQVSPDQANQFFAQLVLPVAVGGFVVREVGLLTDAGELYSVANCAAIEKPENGVSVSLQYRLAVSETANIELKVATGDGLFLRIDKNLTEIAAKGQTAQKSAREALDVVDATISRKGLVQLSSATNSTSEALGATPKAVKVAYDLADTANKAAKAANDNANGRVPSTRKVNGKALSSDFDITSQDIFNGQAAGIGNAADLNSYTTPGLYYQPANVQAQSGKNYPEGNAGSLEVYKHAGITQIYRIYNNSRSYIRTLYGGSWSAWTKQYDAANKPTPGDIGAVNKAGDTMTGGLGMGGNLSLKGDQRLHITLGNADGKTRMYLYKDKGGDGIHINNGVDGGGDYIFHKDGGFRAPSGIYAGAARMAGDGNIFGSKWGNQWLDAYLRNTYQPKGNYTPAGQAYTKAESDGRFQPKGNYTPAGQAYTKAESDARFVRDVRLGSQVKVNGSVNSGLASLTAPSGHMLTAILDGDTKRWPMPDSPDSAYARAIQKFLNNKWVTVSQL